MSICIKNVPFTTQLPLFLKLCKDEVWGVRKACADVFPDISLACNLGTRHDRLTPSYLKLLHDESRWVSISFVFFVVSEGVLF